MLKDYRVFYERNRSKGMETFKGAHAKKKAYAKYNQWVGLGGYVSIHSAPIGTNNYRLIEEKGSKD